MVEKQRLRKVYCAEGKNGTHRKGRGGRREKKRERKRREREARYDEISSSNGGAVHADEAKNLLDQF
jgi:hypothetical protein